MGATPTGYEWEPGYASFRAYGEAGRDVSWVVYADRDDPAIQRLRTPVVEEKGPAVGCPKGKLLDPLAYGFPEEQGVGYEEKRQHRERVHLMQAQRGTSPQGGEQ